MGKYLNILNKNELTYDDLITLQMANKIKGALSKDLILVKHNGDMYIKKINYDLIKHLM